VDRLKHLHHALGWATIEIIDVKNNALDWRFAAKECLKGS
jgi:hypothetical protein